MTQPPQAGGAPYWERPRVNGRFSRDPNLPPKPNKQIGDLHRLRNVAMRLSTHLQQMMPPLKEAPGEEDKPAKPLSPAFKLLLGPHGSVIGAFDTLVQLVCQLLDKEGETNGKSPDPLAFDEEDELEADRRIHEELDRIAARKRAAGGAGQP